MNVEMPSHRWIRAALRVTTERLMHEIAMPSAEQPDWSDAQWRVAQAVAVMHGISPLLATTLRWHGPEHWQRFLIDQRKQTQRHHARIAEVLKLIDKGSKRAGIAVLALKGAALHARGVYAPGERPMADIDLLVNSCHRDDAVRLIESLDYVFCYETWRHTVFEPIEACVPARIGEHADNPIKIELHTAVMERLPIETHGISDCILPSDVSAGVHYYCSLSAMLTHVVYHAAGALASSRVRALHLSDIVRLAAQIRDEDWSEMLELGEEGRLGWAFPPLILVERYFPGRIPKHVIDVARRCCPWPLRVMCVRKGLSDVSLSNPRIPACPGLEWSSTLGEAIRYVRARLRPDVVVWGMHETLGKDPSLDPQASALGQPPVQRMLRWAAGQRTRIETMASVHAAFGVD